MADYDILLNELQQGVITEILEQDKRSGILKGYMGMGKTRTMLSLAMMFTEEDEQVLIVCTKSLTTSWIDEINKYFPNFTYMVYHKEFLKKEFEKVADFNVKFIITTPEVLRKHYQENHMERRLVVKREISTFGRLTTEVNDYMFFKSPVSSDLGLIYGRRWGMLIVDEIHEMVNCETDKFRSILSIPCSKRWGLSGTPFCEIDPAKMTGYFAFLHVGVNRETSCCLPEVCELMKDDSFEGMNQYTIVRERGDNEEEKEYEIVPYEMFVDLNPNEWKVYSLLRNICTRLSALKKRANDMKDKATSKIIGGILFSYIGYIKLALISPGMIISNLLLNIYLMNNEDIFGGIKGDIMRILNEVSGVNRTNLSDYFQFEENIVSDRVKKAMQIVQEYKNVVVFTTHRMSINIIIEYLEMQSGVKGYTECGKRILTLEGTDSLVKRREKIGSTSNTEDYLFLLTYEIGGSGLNLQSGEAVILLDYGWNDADTEQAIARVARKGKVGEVPVYYMLSKTVVEDVIIQKHVDKLKSSKEIMEGKQETKITTIRIKKMIQSLEMEARLDQTFQNLRYEKGY